MKNRLFLLIVCFAFIARQSANSQCMLVPVDLSGLSNASELVIEGRLSLQKTFRHTNNNIYSLYTLQVASVYKGILQDTVYIVSLGGQLDMQITKADPSDELRDGYGIFFLKKSRVSGVGVPAALQYELTASTQGRIWISNDMPDDVFQRYNNYEAFKTMLIGITHSFINLHYVKPDEQRSSPKRATPTITSFTPTTRTAGTDSFITITGTNFNSPRGSGFVAFRDADAGGTSFLLPLASDYISWTNTQIRVKVPTSAGTGTIVVQNSDPANVLSGTSLNVPYNLINVTFGGVHLGTRLQGLNSGAKMLLTFNTRFNDSTKAKRDFVTSMQSWRCKSLINWDTSATTTTDDVAVNDGTHLVTWDFTDTLPLGVLGVAISNFAGCIASGDTFFYVSDLDVLFNDVPFTGFKWEYGPGIPSGSQYDFESVATHELGHGHQLGHVIDANKVMHYSIANGERKNIISTQDSFGAKNIMAKNVVSVCGQTAMTPLTSSNCSYVALPVDWLDVIGENRSKYIALTWKVYHEFNVDKYKVSRSFDGIYFEDIGAVRSSVDRGDNNYYQILTYQYLDNNVLAVKNGAFYRMTSMDYDGQDQNSNLVYVNGSNEAYFFARMENGNIVLLSSMDAERGEVRIFNSIGQELQYQQQDKNIVLSGQPNGIYYVVYQYGDEYITQKIVIDY